MEKLYAIQLLSLLYIMEMYTKTPKTLGQLATWNLTNTVYVMIYKPTIPTGCFVVWQP